MTLSHEQLKNRFQTDLMPRLPIRAARWKWKKEHISAFQQRQLRCLLKHAAKYSLFHTGRLAGVDTECFQLDDLPSLPTMTKTEMMDSFDEVVTDRRLTLQEVQAHLASTGDLPTPLEGDYFAVTSGGSSGVKGVFVYDWDAMLDYTSALMPPDGPPQRKTVIAAVISPSPVHASRLTSSFLDIPNLIQGIHVPVTLSVEEIVRRLNQAQPDVLFGYPSILRQLASEQSAGRLAIRPELLRSAAEQLEEEDEVYLMKVFDAPLLNTFASSEGLFGVKRPGDKSFVFATDLAIVELVDENNQPVPAGAESSKVLITNLFNKAQPLIRYELEDRFIRLPDAPDHGHLVAQVKGKAAETFVYRDTCVNPRVVFAPIIESPRVVDYQIRQTANGIDVDLVVDGDPDLEPLTTNICQRLERAGLMQPVSSVQIVEALRRDPCTGKLRRLVPLGKQE